MRELFAYLKYRAVLLFAYAAASALTLVIYYLAAQDMVYARYTVLLYTVFLALFLVVDGVRFYRKRRALKALSSPFPYAADELPAPKSALEAEYARLFFELSQTYSSLKRQVESAHENSIEYYTLWVHQIKTPIAALSLVLSQMNDERSGVIRQELFKIERYADMALRYVKLSDISSDLLIEPCELYETVRESVKKFGVLFVYQKLSVEIEPFQWQITTDRRWLVFILEQLLSNALKYTPEGGIRIYRAQNALVVEDSGIGIRAEDLPRIFSKGYTGYNGRTDGRASGIGLYLAKKAADALHISIEVQSALAQGTKVFLRFPNPNTDIFK
ncbi:MAG TPA: sensor histidine kinase [Clostridia bacterium]|nr:sensor histidine kinase [Clostridia bacterium]